MKNREDNYLKQELYELMKTESGIFDFIQNGSLDGLWYWDLENPENEWMSDRFWEVLGHNPIEKEHKAAEWQDLIDPDDLRVAVKNFELHCADPQHPYDQVVRYRSQQGKTVWVRCRGLAIRNDAGVPIRMLGAHTDITSLKETEQSMAEAVGRAQAAASAKSRFLANMSHEIRTPMNGVLGMTELALATDLSDIQREYLTTVRDSALQLLRIVNDVLDASALEFGSFSLQSVPFEVRSVTSSAARTLSALAKEKGLGLNHTCDEAIPPRLTGDPDRIRQVLLNLAGNALKFTEEGNVDIAVRLTQKDTSRVWLQITVSDTGPGVPEEQQKLLFEPFFQAPGDRSSGTGLGLSIVAQLVKAMGGRVSLTSTVGKGTAVTVDLPLDIPPDSASSAQDVDTLVGKRALVIDDNATNLHLLREILTGWGMLVELAESAEVALARMAHASRDTFSIALIDTQLPGMSGVEFAAKLREHPRHEGIPLLMLSSTAERPLPSDLQVLSLSKPVRVDPLRSAILALLTQDIPAHRGSKPAPSPTTPARTLRALVVEDNEVNRLIAVRFLESWGHTVIAVEDGTRALSALERKDFDVVLMDVQMEGIDGLEATRRLRATDKDRQRRTPVIALTANALAEDRARCLEAGMDGYVAKPVTGTELFEEVERATRQASPAP